MSKDRIIVLDSGSLGYLCHPRYRNFIITWRDFLDSIDAQFTLPAIIDYEYRRKCRLENFKDSIRTLDKFRQREQYLELTRADLDLAADLWADCRSKGRATTDRKKLDVDVILVAQAISLLEEFSEVIIATSDPADLNIFRTEYEFQIWDWNEAIDDIDLGRSITFYEPDLPD